MTFSDKTYIKIKWVVATVLPALGVLVGILGKAYGYQNTDIVVTTISAITVFLGSIMLKSTSDFNKTISVNEASQDTNKEVK